MSKKVKLKICGETRTHYTCPITPAHTICGNQYEDDDEACDTLVIGDAKDTARITCEPCRIFVAYCKKDL